MKSLLGKLGVILIGVAIFSCAEVWGEDWRFIGETDRFFSLYDAESIVRPSKNVVTVWKVCVYNEKGVKDMVAVFGKKVKNLSYGKFLTELDCKEKKLRYLQTIFYSGDERILHKRTISPSSNKGWYFFSPESMGEDLWEEVCWENLFLVFLSQLK